MMCVGFYVQSINHHVQFVMYILTWYDVSKLIKPLKIRQIFIYVHSSMANCFPLEDPEMSPITCTATLRSVVNPCMAQLL
jgi:hypothetical protein